MRFVPLRVSCPSPVCRLASSGGGGGSPVPFLPTRFCVVRPLVGGPVRPGRSGVGGVGGGGVCVPPSLGGVVGGPRGAGGGGSLCLGPSLCLPWAGTKAGFIGVAQFMEGVVRILFRFMSTCCRPDAVRGVPLRAGAGLLARRGHCGSGRVAVGGRMAYVPSGAPPRVSRPSRGGFPPGWGGGRGGGGGGHTGVPRRPSPVPWFVSRAAAGGWLESPCPDPPCGRLCGAARLPLHRALPGLFGIPGRRARPGGLAASGSVPAVTPAHVPRGRPGWGGRSVSRPPLGAGWGAP